jgi:transposase
MANWSRPIVLSELERQQLERWQRSPSAPAGEVRRARAILLMADHVSGTDIARQTGYTTVQVSRIRRRFAETGLAGLPDRARSGRPPTVTRRTTARVVALTLTPAPPGVTHWSSRDLARKIGGVSHTTVHRIWRAHALQPHVIETFKHSTDPEAEPKIDDVVGLYLQPPTNAVILSVDEKTQIQALSRTQPLLPMRPGLPARRPHDYRRHGLTSLDAAFNVKSGEVVGACHDRHTAVEFLDFLQVLHRRYRRGDLHVILDNSSTHSTAAIRAWLEAHPRVQFHFTPTGASWLNLVEVWFSILTRKSVRRGSFDSVRALVTHIRRSIETWNDHPTPFVWTKEPADLIKKVVRRKH